MGLCPASILGNNIDFLNVNIPQESQSLPTACSQSDLASPIYWSYVVRLRVEGGGEQEGSPDFWASEPSNSQPFAM